MNIQIKTITLTNFKGVRSLHVVFDHTTTIMGDNGTGKSTIFDAFTWLLFGKDSHDAKDFGIKTLENGLVIPQIDHTVEAILNVDGVERTLRRTYAEKWTRRRGADESELTGHETTFFINGVPQQAGEYKAKIDEIVNESLFKLLTSATYFNSMKWQDRRQVLITIAGAVNDTDVMKSMDKKQVKVLTDIIESGKPLADFKKELSIKKKKLQDELKGIPPRVDEVKRAMPEPADYEQVKKDIYQKQVALLEIENTITNQVEAYKEAANAQNAKQQEILSLRRRMQTIEFEAQSEAQKDINSRAFQLNDLKQKGRNANEQLKQEQRHAEQLLSTKENTEKSLYELRNKWSETSAEVLTFEEGSFNCPTCGQELPVDTITSRKEIMIADFEKNKASKLNSLKAEGTRLNNLLNEVSDRTKVTSEAIATLTAEVQSLAKQVRDLEAVTVTPAEVEFPAEYHEIKAKVEAMELSIMEAPRLDVDGLKQQKGSLSMEIESLKKVLSSEAIIKQSNARIKELLAQEKEFAQSLSNLEKQEFAIEAYTKASMDTVEKAVNDRFSIVKFRMFNHLINGGTEETCETLVRGVQYHDCNSAGKIQAGLDIINVLSQHYNLLAPVFVDNAETVNELPPVASQLIRLTVSKDKSLVII